MLYLPLKIFQASAVCNHNGVYLVRALIEDLIHEKVGITIAQF